MTVSGDIHSIKFGSFDIVDAYLGDQPVDLAMLLGGGSGGGGSPAPPPGDPGAGALFYDAFSAGALDGTSWIKLRPTYSFMQLAPPRDYNTFVDPATGYLVLRLKRESPAIPDVNGVLRNFSAAYVATYTDGSGWPPTKKLKSWTVPFRIEMQWLRPPRVAGIWPGFWLMEVNKTTAEGLAELDISENATNVPDTRTAYYQHFWVNRTDVGNYTGLNPTTTDQSTRWHVWTADVRASGVTVHSEDPLDGRGPLLVANGPSVHADAEFGLIIDVAVKSTFNPPAGDAGPWDLLIDYVKVTAL